MKIVSLTPFETRGMIPITGYENVERAIMLFASGTMRSAQATNNQLLDEVGARSGGMAVGVILLAEVKLGDPDRFTKTLLEEAERKLDSGDRFYGSYDYDAMGTPFFKSSVDIVRLDRKNDIYGLKLSAAYVGNKPEEELAEALGITRCLYSCGVSVETEKLEGNRFEFDFEPIIDKLRPLLKYSKHMTGRSVAAKLMEDDPDRTRPRYVIDPRGYIHVSIAPERVAMRYDYDERPKKDTWSVDGAKLSGNLERDFRTNDRQVKATPTFRITVYEPSKNYSSPPVFDLKRQTEMLDLSNKILAALS